MRRINLYGHVQRMENLLPRDEVNRLFRAPGHLGSDFPNELVCPVRGAETLGAIHPGYTLIPTSFYKELREKTGRRLAFVGQLGDDPYSKQLRESFPNDIFLESNGALADFQTIRKARHIVLPVSTFAWLAAWMSDAEQIHLPVFGLYNPARWPKHDLLPIGEPRYRFYQFPIQDAVPVEEFEQAHASLSWKVIDRLALLRT